MAAAPVTFPYDPDLFIHVPLDYVGTQWADAGEWADWLADRALRGRADEDVLREALRSDAREIALFPAAHVSARFWHYPVDGSPDGFVDLYVQARAGSARAVDLLPDPGFTVVDPVDEELSGDTYRDAVRRLTLRAILPGEDAEPIVMPRAEWLGIAQEWVCYAISVDHDPVRLLERVPAVDALFASVEIPEVAA